MSIVVDHSFHRNLWMCIISITVLFGFSYAL